jgi:hypothetical protein
MLYLVQGDRFVLICCNGTTSVISDAEARNKPIVVDDGCRAEWRIGRAYAWGLRVYVSGIVIERTE